jgi:type I restriction enzyme S subunit
MSRYKAYAEYKESGLKLFPRIPLNWETGKVKYVLENLDRRRIPLSAEERGSRKGDYPYYGASGVIDHVDDYLFDEETILIGEDGANLLSRSTELAFIASGKYWVNNHAHILRANDGLNRFWVRSLENIDISPVVSGSAQPKLTAEALGDLEVVYPSTIEERKQILHFLDHETAKIDTLIAKQQGLIKLLKEKRQAVISHAVTKGLNPNAPMRDSGVEWLGEVPAHWGVCRLKQVIKSGSSISYGIVQPGDALDDGVPFIQTTNMSQGTFDLTELQKTTEEIARAYPRSKLDGGEVILGIRASIGAAYVVPESLRGANLSRGVARIIPNKNISPHFLVMFFRSDAVERYWGLSKQGSTFSEVSIETVRELTVPVPPVDEQDEIYKFSKEKLEDLDRIVDRAVQQQIFLQERRTALISAAVTGKIDVRNWQPASVPELEDAAA